MRKIEQQMNNAISNNQNWQSDNTAVTFDPETDTSTVYLHGNKIAEVGDFGVRLWDGGYQSKTTKSRINAILTEHAISGEGVFQKDYQWFIRLFNGTEFFTTEFRNAMKLGTLSNELLLAWVILKGGTLPPFFYTFLFLFYGRGSGDRFRHQGDPAPPSLVTVL